MALLYSKIYDFFLKEEQKLILNLFALNYHHPALFKLKKKRKLTSMSTFGSLKSPNQIAFGVLLKTLHKRILKSPQNPINFLEAKFE